MAVAIQQRKQSGFILSMAWCIHFFLSVVSLVSILLLIVGFVVSMSNVMTGGAIVDNDLMKRAWAIATSSAIEANIPLMFYSAWASWRDGKSLEGLCSLLLGLALAIITGISVGIESLQQSLAGQTIESATLKMHIDMATFIYFRVALIILLVAREGYHLFTILEDASAQENAGEDIQTLPEKKPFFLWVWLQKIWYFISFQWLKRSEQKDLPTVQENEGEEQNISPENMEGKASGEDEKDTQSKGKVERETDPNMQAVKAEVTQVLSQKDGEKSTLRVADFSKNFYSRREAATMAKVSLAIIDQAITSGELSCSKGDREKILKSSLKPFVGKQKSMRSKREKLHVVNG